MSEKRICGTCPHFTDVTAAWNKITVHRCGAPGPGFVYGYRIGKKTRCYRGRLPIKENK